MPIRVARPITLCVARPGYGLCDSRWDNGGGWAGGKQTFGKVSFPSKNKRFQRLVSNRKTKVSPAEVSIELKTNEALFSRKVCFGTEKKGFLKRFVSTLKTNYALNRSKQTFTGKQTKKPRWKKVCFQGFQTLCRQVCLAFWVFNKLSWKRFVSGGETLVLHSQTFVFLRKGCFRPAAAFPTRASVWKL